MPKRTDQMFYRIRRKAQADGEPKARYIKAVKGRVQVSVLDSFEGLPSDVMLKGDPADPELDKEEIIVICWTDMEDEYFRKANEQLIDRGYIAPYTEELVNKISVNEVTDEELREALGKPFFATRALLKKFTSPIPVKRMLEIAEEMNRPVGTCNAIKERLAELQKNNR